MKTAARMIIMILMAVVFTAVTTPVLAQEEEDKSLTDKAKEKAADLSLWGLEKTTGIDIDREEIETGSQFVDFITNYELLQLLTGYSPLYKLTIISLLLLALSILRPELETGKARYGKLFMYLGIRFLIVRALVFGVEILVEFANAGSAIPWILAFAPPLITLFVMKKTLLNKVWWAAIWNLLKSGQISKAILLSTEDIKSPDEETPEVQQGVNPTGLYSCPYCKAPRSAKFCSNASCPGPQTSPAAQTTTTPQQPTTVSTPVQPTTTSTPQKVAGKRRRGFGMGAAARGRSNRS